MNYRLEFTIPELPKPTNAIERKHWAFKVKYVKHWHQLIAAAVGSRKPVKPLRRAQLTLTRLGTREPDFDGLVSSFKHVLDGLIVCGVLENDRPSNIGESKYRFVKCKRSEVGIHVIVDELLESEVA